MECAGRMSKRDRVIDAVVFIFLLAGASAVTLTLFYRQVMYPDRYGADIYWYVQEVAGVDTGLLFPYPLFFKLGRLLSIFVKPELATAISTMILNSMGMIVTKLALNHLVLSSIGDGLKDTQGRAKAGWQTGVMISLLSISLFFISMLYLPVEDGMPGIPYRYLGVFTPTPFHNATYMAARPFAILAFLWYAKLLPIYEKGVAGRNGEEGASAVDYIFFSIFLLLATMTKPSFTLVLVSTAGLIMLYRLFREKFRNLLPTIYLGVCFIPTFIDLLYQFNAVYIAGGSGLNFGIGEVWLQYATNIPLAVCLAVGFPLLVLLLNRKQCKKSTMLCFSWQFYLVSFAEAFLLYEDEPYKLQFNFAWGYMYGIFFCHLAAVITLLRVMLWRNTENVLDRGVRDKRRIFALGFQWLFFVGHVICGCFYFIDLLHGALYY